MGDRLTGTGTTGGPAGGTVGSLMRGTVPEPRLAWGSSAGMCTMSLAADTRGTTSDVTMRSPSCARTPTSYSTLCDLATEESGCKLLYYCCHLVPQPEY